MQQSYTQFYTQNSLIHVNLLINFAAENDPVETT